MTSRITSSTLHQQVRRSRSEGALLHRKGGALLLHRVDVVAGSVFACGSSTDGVFVWEGIWRNTHTRPVTSQLSERPAGMCLRKERLCGGEEEMGGEEEKMWKRPGQEKPAPPPNRHGAERGWERETDPGRAEQRRHVWRWLK